MELNNSEGGSFESEMQTDSDVFSCVSMKSDRSIGNPPNFSGERGEPSCVSMKSDRSIGNPPNFSGERGEPSCVFMKSDRSIGNPPNFSGKRGEPSCVSMKSDRSIGNPPNFSGERGEPSCVSMKSDRSIGNPPNFSREAVSSEPGQNVEDEQQDYYQPVGNVLNRFSERHKKSMKNKYENLFEGLKNQENKTLLHKIYTQLYIIEGESEQVNEEHEVLEMEKSPRKYLQDTPIHYLDIFKPLQGPKRETEEQITGAKSLTHEAQQERPVEGGSNILKIRSVLTKGIAGIGKTVSVQKFILDWAEGTANQDVDLMFMLPFRELNLIKDDQYSLHGLLCAFHPELKDLDPKIYEACKAVFIFDGLDESRISLNFSDCEKVSDITMTSSVAVLMTNLIQGVLLPSAQTWITSRPAAASKIPPQYISRVTEIQGFNDPQKEEYFRKRISDQEEAKKIISHIKTVRSLHIMCHIPVFCWISATVLQQMIRQCNTEIPKTLTEMYLHFLLTQISMKNVKYEEEHEKDPKELLESNRPMLLKLAGLAFIQLIKGNVLFYEEDLRECGIDVTSASVYSGVLTEIFREECVLSQKKVYCFVHLSFQEFLAAVYVFCCYENRNMEVLEFLSPSFSNMSDSQEELDELLMGAVDKTVKIQNGHLDLFLRFLLGISLETNQRLLQGLLTHRQSSSEEPAEYITCLIKGDNSEHYISPEQSINLFLCLSEMNDQSLPRELQEYLKSDQHSSVLSVGQCSALAYMLLTSEEVLDELDLLKYNTSVEGYNRLIPAVAVCKKAQLSCCNLTINACEILGSTLQSVNCLKDLDLSNNELQDSGMELLSAGLESSHCKLETLRVKGCDLGDKACEILGSALGSLNSCLKYLNLSFNDIQDSGVELLSAGLESSQCKLEILRVMSCSIGHKACGILGSALQSAKSSLKELDLSNNDIQNSGVELLTAGLKSSHCKLEILRLICCSLEKQACEFLATALQSVNICLKELNLSNNELQDTGVELLSAGLKSSHCKLETLRLAFCFLTKDSCKTLCSALQSVNSCLKNLDLSNNDIQDSGVELFFAGLRSHCKLETLRLNCCNLGKKSCKILGTTSLPLKELDLSSNDLQDSGVKLLSAGLNKAHSKLKTLRLSGCMVTGKGCSTLASALKSKPSHLKLLDLTYNYPGTSGMKLLSNLVPDLQMKHGDKIRLQLGLKKYACKLTLDPNTAHKHLSVSADERQVEHVKRQKRQTEDHPDRFEVCEQVLSRESMTGRCYWEAEWKGDGASVAVSYSSIRREGNSDDSLFGFNNKSWSLHCTDNSFSVWHNNKETEIPVHTSSTRVAVYLDWKASILSFYSISPKTRTMTHLHTLQTSFSEPLYAGFYVSYNSSVCVCT